jgi:HEAT repeat protein
MGLRKNAPPDLHPVQARERKRDLLGLMAQLSDADANARRWAARDLAGHAAAASTMGQALQRERDLSVREALFTSLSAMDDEGAVKVLLPLLRSDEAALRNGAIEALAAMPQRVAPWVDRLLSDPDADVRLMTVNLLGELRHPQVGHWLTQVLDQDAHVNVVAGAIEVMTEVGDSQHRDVLLRARERFAQDPFIGFATELALQRIDAS